MAATLVMLRALFQGLKRIILRPQAKSAKSATRKEFLALFRLVQVAANQFAESVLFWRENFCRPAKFKSARSAEPLMRSVFWKQLSAKWRLLPIER